MVSLEPHALRSGGDATAGEGRERSVEGPWKVVEGQLEVSGTSLLGDSSEIAIRGWGVIQGHQMPSGAARGTSSGPGDRGHAHAYARRREAEEHEVFHSRLEAGRLVHAVDGEDERAHLVGLQQQQALVGLVLELDVPKEGRPWTVSGRPVECRARPWKKVTEGRGTPWKKVVEGHGRPWKVSGVRGRGLTRREDRPCAPTSSASCTQRAAAR